MKIYKELYVGNDLKKHKNKILKKIKNKKLQSNIYIIVMSDSQNNQLEFYDSLFAVQGIYSLENVLVVGIAKGYEGAITLVTKIIGDIYIQTNDVNIRSYIQKKQHAFEESEE